MEWENDCLCIFFAHMKNDQGRYRKRDPRHVYSNPHDPIICPILALAIYFSTFNLSGTKGSQLFPGDNQYKRFSKYLEKLCIKHEKEILSEFGIKIEDIGVHSLRKGAASFVSSGSTCAPPQVATNIRARWSMGIIQDTYLRYEAAGDQYVGRVVCGLPLSSPKFAVLPCQVDCSVEESNKMVEAVFPSIPGKLHCMARFFAASILYHSKFLTNYLPKTHPFCTSLCLTSSEVPSLLEKTSLAYAWEECDIIDVYQGEYDSTDSELSSIIRASANTSQETNSSLEPTAAIPERRLKVTKATGIPTHVMLLADMQKVIKAQHQFLVKMKNLINEEFDKREVGHATFQVQKQVEQMLASFE